jgi:hypothetical protein
MGEVFEKDARCARRTAESLGKPRPEVLREGAFK